jgi:hypothetical protein
LCGGDTLIAMANLCISFSLPGNEMYIHYGASEFSQNRFEEIKNIAGFSKPLGGLWASPILSKLSWKSFCESNAFRQEALKKCFLFQLKKASRVLYVTQTKDLGCMPKQNTCLFGKNHLDIDYEALIEENVDAIRVDVSRLTWDKPKGELISLVRGWDVDSLLLLNVDCIIPMKL